MSTINLAAYCSGDFGPGITNECIADAQQSGFTTLILWAMHIGRAGDLNNSNCQAVPGQSWGSWSSMMVISASPMATPLTPIMTPT